MKLSQCRAFVSVADAGTFTGAAKLIGVSQSAVSHAIAALEKELGTELLNREHGRITLTPAGRRVLQSARIMLKHAQEIASVSSRVVSIAKPRLRVGVGRSFGKRALPRLLSDLRVRYPDMALDVRVGPCTDVEDWLRRGLVDVGVGTLAGSGLPAETVLRDTMHVVLPAGHPLNAGTTVHVRQLAGESLLMPGEAPERELCSFLQSHGVTPRIGFRVDDLGTLMTLSANGHGLTVLPGIAIPVKAPRLRALPLIPVMPADQLVSVSKAGEANPFAEEFIELLKSSLHACEWQAPVSRPSAVPLTVMPGGLAAPPRRPPRPAVLAEAE